MSVSRLSLPCLVALATLAGCVPRAETPPPRPAPAPQPAPAPRPSPPPVPTPPVGWEDAPIASGDWTYGERGGAPEASFGSPGGTLFVMRCAGGGQISITRPGTGGGQIGIVTGFGERNLPGGGTDQAQAVLPASDPLFDQIAFSRGRFLVRTASADDLILPSWPEPARVAEECRRQ